MTSDLFTFVKSNITWKIDRSRKSPPISFRSLAELDSEVDTWITVRTRRTSWRHLYIRTGTRAMSGKDARLLLKKKIPPCHRTAAFKEEKERETELSLSLSISIVNGSSQKNFFQTRFLPSSPWMSSS